VSGRRISGQVQALTAEWNKLYFNQGSPKPGASSPRVTGRYNPRTHAYLITWKSLIHSGPFNGFTGVWHLQGRVGGGRRSGGRRRHQEEAPLPEGQALEHQGEEVRQEEAQDGTGGPRCTRRGGEPLVGTFRLTTGTWGSNGATGS